MKKTDCSQSNAVVISCTGLAIMDIIDDLEKNIEKPVLTSNQFGLWGALREIGVKEKIAGIGCLFDQ